MTLLRLPALAVHPWYGVDPTADMVGWVAEFYRRLPDPGLWSALSTIRSWHGDDPACPADLRGVRGHTKPGDLSIELNQVWDQRQVLAHEMGHAAQHHWGMLVTGDLSGQHLLSVAARDGSFARADEEAFANAVGAYLLGDNFRRCLWRHVPAVLALWRAAPAWVQAPGLDTWAQAVNWTNVGAGRAERYRDGLHQALVGGAWVEVA